MKAATTMTRDVVCVPPELPLSRAWSLMQELRIRHLPVVSQGALQGLLSDRDILLRAVADVRGNPFVEEGLVGEAMSLEPRICHAQTPVSQLAQVMIDEKIDALPVVSETDATKVIGLVSSTDLLWLLVHDDETVLPMEFRVRFFGNDDVIAVA